MSPEEIVTVVSTIGAVVLALVPVFVRYMRAKGLEISESTERLIRDAASEGVRFAEEYARKQPQTSSQKLMLATLHTQRLLSSSGIKLASDVVGERIEAQIQAALPGRGPASKLSIPPELR